MQDFNVKTISAAALLAFASATHADQQKAPSFINGPILKAVYDGVSDDLLTAGLGKTGLTLAAPGFVDPLNRRRRNCAAARST
jgi:hydroxybutyrate-dimer hydrolase